MAASLFPNPSSTTPAEKEKEAVPEPKAVNERVPRLKADVCKASSSVGESREISANSTIPGENMKSVKASGRLAPGSPRSAPKLTSVGKSSAGSKLTLRSNAPTDGGCPMPETPTSTLAVCPPMTV